MYSTEYIDLLKDNQIHEYEHNSPTNMSAFSAGNVIDISGGAAGTAGFMLSTANNIIIGFSLSGSDIPMGDGILVVLEVTGSGDACIVEESLIISDAEGVALLAGIENCNTIYFP